MRSLQWIFLCRILALSFVSPTQEAPDQDLDGSGLIMTDPVLSYRLLEPSYELRKVQVLMRQKEEGRFPEQGLAWDVQSDSSARCIRGQWSEF